MPLAYRIAPTSGLTTRRRSLVPRGDRCKALALSPPRPPRGYGSLRSWSQKLKARRTSGGSHRVLGNSDLASTETLHPHRRPGACVKRRSALTRVASIVSAKATYAASYGVMFGCSSHIRTNSGRWLTRSRSRSARSARAMAARRSSRTPAKSAFRITATTSRSSNSGATRRSPCRRSRARSPSASSSARAGATTDASTTITQRPCPPEPPRLRSGTKRVHRHWGRAQARGCSPGDRLRSSTHSRTARERRHRLDVDQLRNCTCSMIHIPLRVEVARSLYGCAGLRSMT